MTDVVTGAGGLIGRHLVARLVRSGRTVRTMVRKPSDLPELAGAEVVVGDIASAADVDRCLAGARRVYHLAANVSHGSDRASIWGPNVDGTAHIVRAATREGVERLVFVSSASVYGRAVTRHALTEDSPPQPDSIYGASKLAAEALVLEAHRRDGLPAVVVRTSNVMGPGAVAWLGVAQGVASGRFKLAGEGEGLHTLTEMEDFLDGLDLCVQAPGIAGEVFLLTGAKPLSLRAWLDAMALEAGVAPPRQGWPEGLLRLYAVGDRLSLSALGRRLPRADRLDFFLGDRSFDIAKARRMLGYAPKVSGTDVARRLVRWYVETGLLRA